VFYAVVWLVKFRLLSFLAVFGWVYWRLGDEWAQCWFRCRLHED